MEPIPTNSNTNNTLGNVSIETPNFNPDLQKTENQLIQPEAVPVVSSEKEAVNTTTSDNTILPVTDASLVSNDDTKPTLGLKQVLPSSASDQEIEPAWVEAAKKIIQNTDNDPHERLEDVKKLKQDYQAKRNGALS